DQADEHQRPERTLHPAGSAAQQPGRGEREQEHDRGVEALAAERAEEEGAGGVERFDRRAHGRSSGSSSLSVSPSRRSSSATSSSLQLSPPASSETTGAAPTSATRSAKSRTARARPA